MGIKISIRALIYLFLATSSVVNFSHANVLGKSSEVGTLIRLASNKAKSVCNEITCPPPKQCITDDWNTDDYYCHDPAGRQADNGDSSGMPSCLGEVNSLLESCRNEVQEASGSCDEKKDSGLTSVSGQASQLALMFGQMASSSVHAACSRMAKVSQAANAAVAAYQIACSSSIEQCKSACTSARSLATSNSSCLVGGDLIGMIASIDEELNKCNNLTANVAQANMAIQNLVGTTANSSQCAAMNDGTGVLPEICKTDPKNPLCVRPGEADCTKPEMASNKVCVCSRNPLDPMCTSGQKVGGGLGAGTGSNIDSSSRLANKADASRYGDIPSLPEIEQGEFKGSSGSDGPDAEKVGNGGVGGGGGSSGGGGAVRGSSGGEDAESSKVVSGFYGGSSKSGGFGSVGSRGGSNDDGYGAGKGNGGVGDNPSPDLRKFLPGGQYDPRRMISGVSGPDGITGPHSNIWQKVQNRYMIVRPTLLP